MNNNKNKRLVIAHTQKKWIKEEIKKYYLITGKENVQ